MSALWQSYIIIADGQRHHRRMWKKHISCSETLQPALGSDQEIFSRSVMWHTMITKCPPAPAHQRGSFNQPLCWFRCLFSFKYFASCCTNLICSLSVLFPPATMAQAPLTVEPAQLLEDPVTIPCGHSYCMSCLTGAYWHHQRVCSSP